MRKLSLGEVVKAGRLAESVSRDGATLHYRPEQQVLGRALIIEVTWPTGAEGSFGHVEVVPDLSGEHLVQPAEIADDTLPAEGQFRLPQVPDSGWTHQQDCDCRHCRQ